MTVSFLGMNGGGDSRSVRDRVALAAEWSEPVASMPAHLRVQLVQILGTQEKFLAAMTSLFEKYKEEAGYPDLTLEIR